jgi:Tfp pilus assembly protein PilF
MLIARAMLDAEVSDRVEYAITDLKQVLEQDPSQMLATMLLADLYRTHPTNPDKAMARKILETRLELEFEEEEDRLAIQNMLDELVTNILNDE